MTLFEAYLYLFTDSFFAHFVVFAQSMFVMPVMLMFGGYNVYLIAFIVTVAGVLAVIANWLIGRMLFVVLVSKVKNDSSGRFARVLVIVFNCLLVLVWVPVLGAFISMFAGAVGVRLRYVVLAMLVLRVGVMLVLL